MESNNQVGKEISGPDSKSQTFQDQLSKTLIESIQIQLIECQKHEEKIKILQEEEKKTEQQESQLDFMIKSQQEELTLLERTKGDLMLWLNGFKEEKVEVCNALTQQLRDMKVFLGNFKKEFKNQAIIISELRRFVNYQSQKEIDDMHNALLSLSDLKALKENEENSNNNLALFKKKVESLNDHLNQEKQLLIEKIDRKAKYIMEAKMLCQQCNELKISLQLIKEEVCLSRQRVPDEIINDQTSQKMKVWAIKVQALIDQGKLKLQTANKTQQELQVDLNIAAYDSKIKTEQVEEIVQSISKTKDRIKALEAQKSQLHKEKFNLEIQSNALQSKQSILNESQQSLQTKLQLAQDRNLTMSKELTNSLYSSCTNEAEKISQSILDAQVDILELERQSDLLDASISNQLSKQSQTFIDKKRLDYEVMEAETLKCQTAFENVEKLKFNMKVEVQIEQNQFIEVMKSFSLTKVYELQAMFVVFALFFCGMQQLLIKLIN